MKTWGSWGRVVKLVGTTAVVASLSLLAYFQGSARREQEAGVGVSPATTYRAPKPDRAKENPRLIDAYGRLPLSFEENVGQTAQEVRYVSHGAGYELFLTSKEAVLGLRAPVQFDLSPRHRFKTVKAIREALRARAMTAIRLGFEGANRNAQITATDKLVKKTSYFVGNDPRKWRTDVASYARVNYSDVYPGVDLVFYGNQHRLEYDFIVAPGANPDAIRLNLQGARKLRINADGDVVLSVAGGELVLQKPVVYQMVKGKRQEIAGSYKLTKDHLVAFSVPVYDRSEPLILDPVLNYSTYLGGSLGTTTVPPGTGLDQGLGIAVDSTGNAFVAGTTFSTDFPTTSSAFNAGPLASNQGGAIFVTEMNPTGTAEVYSTYLAGNSGELGVALALDPAGKIYVTGLTFSSTFPTTSNALKQSPNTANLNIGTSFLSKIDPALSGTASLVYSSYIGGTGGSAGFSDFGNAVAVDANGNAYVTGITFSSPGNGQANFPVLNAFQATPNDSTNGNAFLTRIDTTKSGSASLIYSTYLGGSGANAATLGYGDQGFGVAVDGSSNAYIVGVTSSTDFPTLNGFQTTAPAAIANGTIFVTRIDTTKTGNASEIYSTFLGGNGKDEGFAIALGPNNVAYLTGTTTSTAIGAPGIPAGAFNPTGGATGLAFIGLVDTGKTGAASLKYWTFLGGTSTDTGIGIRADGTGIAYAVGSTSSTNFPITPGALQPVYPGAAADGFVTKLNPGGNGTADLLYSTFFGGNGAGQDQVDAVALDASSPPNVFITGETFSSASSFPIFPSTAFQTTLHGTSDAFISKLSLIPTLVVSPTALNFGTVVIPNTSPAQSVTLTNNTNAAIAFTSAAFSGANAADFAISANTCGANIAAGASCSVSVTFKPSAPPAAEVAKLVLTDGDSTSPQMISLTGSGSNTAPDFTIAASAPTPSTVKAGSSATFTVTVTPVGGFSSAVALTCTEPAAMTLSTCTASPASVTPNGAAVTSTVTVTTTAPSLMTPPPSVPTRPLPIRQIIPLLVALILLFLLPTAKRLRLRLGMATAMLILLALAGCSGSSAPKKPGTPAGTYSLTVTGTSGATTHTSAAVSLTVN